MCRSEDGDIEDLVVLVVLCYHQISLFPSYSQECVC